MATRLKTLEYYFLSGTTASDATDTSLTQLNVYIPDAIASNAFTSVLLEVMVHDRNTSLGNISRRQCSLRLGAAGYTDVNNTNALTNGGEQQIIAFSGDFTSHFNTNWSGTSMTCDAKVLLDSAVASPLTPSFNNITAKLIITYQYDDTKATQIKTVRIPLNAPVGTMATSKPGTATATIPALNTELPEANKTYRQKVFVVQGNDNSNATTDIALNMQVESSSSFASDTYEHGSTVAMFYRNTFIQDFATHGTQGFYLWATGATNFNHAQAWLVVTYEFTVSGTTSLFNSLLLPMEVESPMGPSSTVFQRATRDVWIEEPATITTKQIAFYPFWDQLAATATVGFRIGTGSFVTYTDAAAVLGGSNAAMVRNDSAFTLTRGRNTINFDCYTTDAADVGYNIGGFWIVNYTSGVPNAGIGAENKTVLHAIRATGTDAAAVQQLFSGSMNIPESNFFIGGLGIEYKYVPSSATAVTGCTIGVERLTSEGGLKWDTLYADIGGTDGETGVYHAYAQVRDAFYRWTGDVDSERLSFETARRLRAATANSVACTHQLVGMVTYHSIPFTISGSISGSAGGTVNLRVHRSGSGEMILSGSRTGDGSYSFTWYDNTEPVYVTAYENGSHLGMSSFSTASGTA